MYDMKDNKTEHKSRPSLLEKLNDGIKHLPSTSSDEYTSQYLIQPSYYQANSHYRLYHHKDCVTYDVHAGHPDRPWLIPSHTLAVKLSIKTQLMIEMTTYAAQLNDGWGPNWASDEIKHGIVIEPYFNRVIISRDCVHNPFVFGIVVKDHVAANVLHGMFASRVKAVFIDLDNTTTGK